MSSFHYFSEYRLLHCALVFIQLYLITILLTFLDSGARIIYAEVVRLRGLTPDPSDPTRSFLDWAKLTSIHTPRGIDDLDAAFSSSMQHRAMILPLLQPDQFHIPTPPPLTRSSSGGSTGTDADEPEYGPKYVPFVPTTVDTVSFPVYKRHLFR